MFIKSFRQGVSALLLLLVYLHAAANDAPVTQPYIVSTEAKPEIDGELNDEVWSEAVLISEFHQTRPEDHGVPTQKTEAQLARDENYIYVAIRAHDTEIEKLVAKGLIQGQNFFSDERVAITLDTFNDKRNSYFFQVNPNGIRRDALLGNDYFIDEWDTIWYAASKVHDWGWSAEMAIPLKSIAFDPDLTTWGLNLTRVSPRRGEDMAWSSVDRNTNPSTFGLLQDMRGFSQGRGLELTPSVSVGYVDNKENGSETTFEPSLTGFYNLTPFLTAGLTLNTDFSGTEADERQVNLGRFSLFFPEKRDFFLRDASIFEFGGIERNARPFFSRRIGLSNAGDPLDLKTGLKLSGRAGDWNIGALAINQDTIDPEADENLFVGRVTRNIGRESEFGLITTIGDPNRDSDNHVYGLDYTYRNSQLFGDKSLISNFWFQESDTNGIDSGQRAYGVQVDYPNYEYDGYFELRRIEENFNPALGFVNRKGVTQGYTQLRHRHPMAGGFWQWLGTRVQYFRADRIGGGLQSEEKTWNIFEGFSRSNDFFTIFLVEESEGLEQSFTLPGDIEVLPGLYTGNRLGVFIETGQQRPVRFEFEVSDGDFFDGKRRLIAPTVEWRPNKHFFLGLSATQNRVELPRGTFTSKLYSARANIAFNSKWAWLNLIQGDNVSDTVSVNSRIRYQPRADREFFLVFNHTRDTETDESMDTAVILKAAFNFQL